MHRFHLAGGDISTGRPAQKDRLPAPQTSASSSLERNAVLSLSFWILWGTMGCTPAAERAHDPAPADPTDIHRSALRPGHEGTSSAGFSDNIWPDIAQHEAPPETQWRAVRYETIAVRLALPSEAVLSEERAPYGHPLLVVQYEGIRVEISFSSGDRVFAHGLAETPPNLAGQPIERISRLGTNTTIHYQRQGHDVVLGWTRGARCKAEYLQPDEVVHAFDICATMMTPRPGPLVQPNAEQDGWPLPVLPHYATVVLGSPPSFHAGHVRARLLPRSCPTREALAELRSDGELELESRSVEGTQFLLGRDHARLDDDHYETTVSVWVERSGRCCIATILEGMLSPTDEQIDYLQHICLP